jgi:hypothetical protein
LKNENVRGSYANIVRRAAAGLGIDYEALSADMEADSAAEHALITDICEAELTGIAAMEDIIMDGDSFELLSTAGFWDAAFEDNLLPLGERFAAPLSHKNPGTTTSEHRTIWL